MLLIGIKAVSEHGSSNSSEGFGGFSITASKVDILSEGNREELELLVKIAKQQNAKQKKEFKELQFRLENGFLSEDEYDKEYDRIVALKFAGIAKYDKLILIDGIVL